MKKPNQPRLYKKAKVVLLPEELNGRELKSWARKKKIPVLKRKMRRTLPDPRTKVLQESLHGKDKQRGKLTFIRRYPKHDPPLVRTKWPIKKKMVRTKFKVK